MSENKNIDRLFQEKFKDFEVAPNDAIWNRISESLPNKKQKRRVIPVWWKVAGVAASLVFLLTVGISFFNSDNNSNKAPVVVDTDSKDTNIQNPENTSLQSPNTISNANNRINPSELEVSDLSKQPNKEKTETNSSFSHPIKNSSLLTENNSTKQSNKTQKYLIKEIKSTESKTKNALASNKNSQNTETINDSPTPIKKINSEIKKAIANNSSTVTDNTKTDDFKLNNITTEKQKEKEVIENEKQSIEYAIAENNNEDIIEKEKNDEPNRWSIAPNVAPVYFASLGEGSPIHSQFNTNSKGSDINMSYGISGSYAISKKLKVRTGVNRVNLNYTTSGVYAFTGSDVVIASSNANSIQTQNQGNIVLKADNKISLMSTNVMNRATTPEVFNTKLTGDLDQRFGFIEVPLEIEYKLLDKKIGLNVIGGFSTFFLNENEIFVDLDGTSTLIGEASNINNTSFSANFGLGLNYNFTKNWNINLEPQFKYQINTFNNTFGDFRPFFIGLYTGINYKF